MLKPSFFIVGESKCGTTALDDFLNQHPDIFMARPKEPSFFCTDLHKESVHHTGKCVAPYHKKENYLSLFENAKKGQIAGESSPRYLFSKEAAKNIHDFNPDAKIIIMIRNPVDYLYSQHSMYLFTFVEDEKDFENALKLEKTRKEGKRLPKNTRMPSLLFYSERARFSEHIGRFLKLFPKKHIKIIIFDDFKKDNLKTYKDTLEFLGADNSFMPKISMINANREARFAKIKYFIEKSGLWNLSRRFPKPVYNKFAAIYRAVVFKEKPRAPMDYRLRRSLMKVYKPEVEKLSKITNRNLIRLWGYDKI